MTLFSNNYLKKLTSHLSILIAFLSISISAQTQLEQIRKLKADFVTKMTISTISAAEVEEHMNNMIVKPDFTEVDCKIERKRGVNTNICYSLNGTWPDFNYTTTVGGSWPTMKHLKRTFALAAAYADSNHAYYKNSELKIIIFRALENWAKENYESTI